MVGGGFYGLWVSSQLIQSGIEVTIIEKNSRLMGEASRINQSRIHNGHHYPRSFNTFASSNRNYTNFLTEFKESVYKCKNPLYLVSQNSKINKLKFKRICNIFDEELQNLPESFLEIGNINSIVGGWKINESYFNSDILMRVIMKKVNSNLFRVVKNSEVINIIESDEGVNIIRTENGTKIKEHYNATVIATYGNLDFLNEVNIPKIKLKYEVCEIVNVLPPKVISDCSVTIIDGPFWSLTPWPTFDNYALTHVRYTPMAVFTNYREANNFKILNKSNSNFGMMLNDISNYHKIFKEVKKIKSHLVIKCIFSESEVNDARPILYQFNPKGNILVIIGGKIDNIFDFSAVLAKFKSNIGATNKKVY